MWECGGECGRGTTRAEAGSKNAVRVRVGPAGAVGPHSRTAQRQEEGPLLEP